MLNDLARKQLFALIDEYSPSILNDTRRCENLLQDACGAHGQELTILTNALHERIPVELAKDKNAALIAPLARRLEENYAAAPEAARWAVETWAQALNVLPRPIRQETAFEMPMVSTLPPTVVSTRVGASEQPTILSSEQPTGLGGEVLSASATRRPWTAIALVAFFAVSLVGLAYLGKSANPGPPKISTDDSTPPAADTTPPPVSTTPPTTDPPPTVATTPPTTDPPETPPAPVGSLSDDPAANSLTEPGASIDGTWNIHFSNGGDAYKAVLAMEGSTGVLQITRTPESGETEVISEEVRLWGSSQGLVAAGAKPMDPTTKAPKTNYTPDNFIFEPQSDGSYKPTQNCDKSSGKYQCFSVTGEFYGNLTN